MTISKQQTAIIQAGSDTRHESSLLPLAISDSVAIPQLTSPHQVMVRIAAVALNPTDFKMVNNFPLPGHMVGCDFSGTVEKTTPGAEAAGFRLGTRVCSGTFPYIPGTPDNGAFAQWIAVDWRLLLRLPDSMDDLEGAALGGVGWGTAGLALYDPEALGLTGRPSKPVDTKEPILVYGGATASGTIAMQLLRRSGYTPIAVASSKSSGLAMNYGAAGVACYTSPDCVDTIKSLACKVPIRRAMDCITSSESAAICFSALARTGGRYACLEFIPDSFRTRRAVTVKEVMGFESLGVSIDLGSNSYSREANQGAFEITTEVVREMQKLLDEGAVKPHPVLEVPGAWQGIIKGLEMLQRGDVRGQKLVVRITEA